MVLVVVGVGVGVFADDLALGVNLHHDSAAVLLPHREEVGRVWVDAIVGEVTIGEDPGVSTSTLRESPSVNFFSCC